MTASARRKLKWLALFLLLAAVAAYAAWPCLAGDPEAELSRLVSLLELQPGMTAAEIGAGKGRMTVLLARRLGPSGKVFSTEIDAGKIRAIEKAAANAGVANVTVIQAGEKQTNLPLACCDAIFMRRVYHHVADAASLNRSLFESVHAGGRLAVIDFAPRGWLFWLRRPAGVPENRGGHGIPPDLLARELASAGFLLERRIDDWSGWDYCLVFRKPPRSG